MRVVITGATGFVGRNLAEHCVNTGIEVRATGRSLQAGGELQARGIDFQAADLLDGNGLRDAFAPAECVIHCAGKSADWGRAAEFHAVNVIGTRNLVAACRHHGIGKIVFLSTPSIYYSGRDRLAISEQEPLPRRLQTLYARTKLQAEQELLALDRRHFQVLVLRPRAIYGPHDATITPRILRLARQPRFPLIKGGRALTDLTYIDNLVSLVPLILTAPGDAWGRVYNISNGEPISFRDWFNQVLEIAGLPFRPRNVPVLPAMLLGTAMELASRLPFGPQQPSLTRFSVGYMARSMTLSIEQARCLLGYQPAIGNREGFQRYAAWLGDHQQRR